MNPNDVPPVLPGETLAGKYRIERVLGEGGMGIVFAARHLELEERVAIKFLLRKNDDAAVQRFIREARAAAKVKSEHVCRVFDVARAETGEPYLVMEYLDGTDLADRLRAEGKLPIATVARWMIEACSALAEAHAAGIVHRDLKPANVFLAKRADESSMVKLLDFGISKLSTADAMTSTTAVMGTPIYMSPEQVASAKDVDHRTDIWSLGVIMYELVSGKPPFAGDSLIQLSVKIREADLPPLDSGDAAFDALVTKCLAKDRNSRWANVGELAAALVPFASAGAADLAARVARTLNAGKDALAETLPDDRPKERHPEQETLEPLSTAAKVTEPPRASARWPRVAFGIVAATIAIGLVARTMGPREPTTTTTAPSAAPDVAPIALPSSTAAPSADPTSSVEAIASTKPAAVKPRPTAVVASAAASAPSATASAMPEPAPSATAPAKKKRELDRDDPYAH